MSYNIVERVNKMDSSLSISQLKRAANFANKIGIDEIDQFWRNLCLLEWRKEEEKNV